MKNDLRELFVEAAGDAPRPRRSVDDIVAAGRTLARRRRFGWLAGGTAAVVTAALVAAGAVALPRAASGQQRSPGSVAGAPSSASSVRARPFQLSIKGYQVGEWHVSDALVAASTYQQAAVFKTGYNLNVPADYLTVYQPGVFSPERFAAGTKTEVRGRPALLAQLTYQVEDRFARRGPSPAPSRTIEAAGLAWQYADDAWATLSWSVVASPLPEADLVAVASGLTMGPANTAKVAFRATYVPAGWNLVTVSLHRPPVQGVSQVMFAQGTVPTTGLTEPPDLEKLGIRKFYVEVDQNDPIDEFTGPDPHPNLKTPCKPAFCDRPIPGTGYFGEVYGDLSQAEMKKVIDGLVFDSPTDPGTWHAADTFLAAHG
jgi:hypothetical protein